MLNLLKHTKSISLFKRPLYYFNSVHEKLFDERVSYEKGSLHESQLDKDPIKQFSIWYHIAKETPEIREANAMILSTSTKEGRPSARPVLLKVLYS